MRWITTVLLCLLTTISVIAQTDESAPNLVFADFCDSEGSVLAHFEGGVYDVFRVVDNDLINLTNDDANDYFAATAVVYCGFDYPDADDPNAGVLDHIEVWGLNPEDYFEQVIYITADQIDEAGVSASASKLLDSGSGYSLYRETDGSFTITSPADSEGKVYGFNWERGD
jgi:hypothetical protein